MIETSLIQRVLASRISEALSDTPVVLVTGPRQAGKTTLARQLATPQMRYLTLDDKLTLLSAKNDPVGLVRDLDTAIIDEVQRAPDLLLAIKKSVDEDRRPGRFMLTGSANVMTLPSVADSLAGRMETLTLLPFSQRELHGQSANWIDAAFAGELLNTSSPVIGKDLVETVLRGGYPEAITRTIPRRRSAWARQYIAALIQRDVRDVASVDKLDHLPRFLRALAHVSGQMCNFTKLGGQVGLDSKTANSYTGIFEMMFLLQRVEAWAPNRIKRVVKTPKLQFLDSGLLANLLHLGSSDILKDRSHFGSVLETFVYGELLKHSTTGEDDYQLLYYRDVDKLEVDVVIENSAGQLIGVEVKAAASIKSGDLRGLKRFADAAGRKFRLGVVLYDGTETVPLGENLWAAPISTLWGNA